MTNPAPHLSEDGLANVRDRPLTEAYEVHDVGMAMLKRRLQAHGLYAVEHGDDNRHAEEIVFGSGPDTAIYDDALDAGGDCCAYVEVKTKESAEWFARCNRRHFNEYVNFSHEVSVPVFIWFALINADDGICKREGFFEVTSTDGIDGEVIETDGEQLVFYEDDVETLQDGDEVLLTVDGSDLVGVRRGDQIVGEIPSVHGNDVVQLNEDKLRSTAHVLSRL